MLLGFVVTIVSLGSALYYTMRVGEAAYARNLALKIELSRLRNQICDVDEAHDTFKEQANRSLYTLERQILALERKFKIGAEGERRQAAHVSQSAMKDLVGE